MTICIGCNEDTVDPADPPRYDVMNPEADLNHAELLGPYDAECFANTYTGQHQGVSG